MKKRINATDIDRAIDDIASTVTDVAKQLEQYKLLLDKARSLAYKKGIATLLKMIATILIRWRKYKEAAPYVKEGLKIVNALKEREEVYFQLRLAESEMELVKGRHDEAIAIPTELINTYGDKMSPVTLIRCYLSAGNGYWRQGMLYNAAYTLQKVLQRKEELSGVSGYNLVWITYANVLKDLDLADRARDEMNLILQQPGLSAFDRIVLILNFANLYSLYNDFENCRKYVDECYLLLKADPFPTLKHGVDVNWAAMLVTLGRYAEALPLVIDEQLMQPESFPLRDKAEWKYAVARCLLETGKMGEALPWIEETQKLVDEGGLIRQKILNYDNYFLYYSLKGDRDEARKYHNLFKEAMEENNRMTAQLQARQLDAVINLERKERELQVEKLQLQQVETEAAHARQQNALMQANIDQRNNLIDEFQRAIKRLETSDAKRKEIFKGLNEKISTVRRSNVETAAYDIKFNVSHQEQVQKLHKLFPSITPSEAKIAVMLSSGLSNKEIAAITLTTSRNIETQRLNLRKKLKLQPGQDLVENLNEILSSARDKM